MREGGHVELTVNNAPQALNHKYHIEHFVCSVCNVSLVGKQFTLARQGQKISCVPCHKKVKSQRKRCVCVCRLSIVINIDDVRPTTIVLERRSMARNLMTPPNGPPPVAHRLWPARTLWRPPHRCHRRPHLLSHLHRPLLLQRLSLRVNNLVLL